MFAFVNWFHENSVACFVSIASLCVHNVNCTVSQFGEW